MHEFRKGFTVEGVHRALEALEVHLIAGFGVQVETVFMASVHGHFHGQADRRKTALNIPHPVINAEGIDPAVAVFAAACRSGADGADQDTVIETNPVFSRIHRLKQVGIFLLVDGFHGIVSFCKSNGMFRLQDNPRAPHGPKAICIHGSLTLAPPAAKVNINTILEQSQKEKY